MVNHTLLCPLCGNKNLEISDSKIRNNKSKEAKIYLCRHCGFQFLHPLPATMDELSTYYNGQYRKEFNSETFYDPQQLETFFEDGLPEARSRLERVKPYLNKEDVILEVGCSSGYFLSVIAPYVKHAQGTEWDIASAQYAASKGLEVRRDIMDYPHKFDKIFLFHVLAQVLHPLKYLELLFSRLKDDGILFVETPSCHDALLSYFHIPKFIDFYYQSIVFWYFNANTLSSCLDKAGFSTKIIPIQRYDISNHVHWVYQRCPGGKGKYTDIFSETCNAAYRENLIKLGMTDTILAVCFKKK